ncbi:MAG: YraN family protein [Corynebacterium flavescens]|nr:YraN family protein [Corynebacterium flavescens]
MINKGDNRRDFRHRLGRKGEAFAAQFYRHRGAEVIAANVRYAVGEIDLIVREADGTLVFVEVKTRSSRAYGVAEAVTGAKLARMRKAARHWLDGRPLSSVRFAVVALTQAGAGFDLEHFAGVEHGSR